MQTVQDRLTFWLRANRTIYFCYGCLALKLGALPREVQDALAAIGRRGDRVQLATGQCSECLRTRPVVRTFEAVSTESISRSRPAVGLRAGAG